MTTSPYLGEVGNKRIRRAVVIVGLELVICVLLYLLLEPQVGRLAAVVVLLPVVTAAILLGRTGGLTTASICFLVNYVLFTFVDSGAAEYGFRFLDLPGNLGLIVIGAAIGFLRDRQAGLAAEVGEHLAMERMARNAEQQIRTILDNAPIVITIIDPEGHIRFVNQTSLLPAELLVGRHIKELVHPEDWPTFAECRDLVLQKGEAAGCEIRARRPDGVLTHYRINLGPLFDGGEIGSLIVASTDITSRKELETLRARFIDRVVAAQEEERRRIARELHDVTAQALTSLLIGLRVMGELPDVESIRKRLQELRNLAGNTLDELNHLARGLHPSVLDDVGFPAALERYCGEFSKTYGVNVDLEIVGLGVGTRLPGPVEITLYRIAQEALVNVAKHAGASRIGVVVERKDEVVSAIIEDDGRGFVINEKTGLPNESTGLGLLGIRERVELLGGSVTIESTHGAGTTLFVKLPVVPKIAKMRAS